MDSLNPQKLIKRHAGVLGMSACVQAFPYDVPEFMPQILMDLSDHLDDPQPIQVLRYFLTPIFLVLRLLLLLCLTYLIILFTDDCKENSFEFSSYPS